ncbi:MAG: hypothetical protein AAFQ13_00315 [Pseudomonadota bacterium]
MRIGLLLTALAAFAAPGSFAAVALAQDPPAAEMPAREGIEARHPSDMIDLAEALFATEEGKEEGLFWYYAGELRWKTLIGCTAPNSFEETKRMSDRLNEVGAPIRLWSRDNIDTLLATLDKVEAWDRETTTRYASGPKCEAEAQLLRDSIPDLKRFIEENRPDR